MSGRSYSGTRGRWFWFSFSENDYAEFVRNSNAMVDIGPRHALGFRGFIRWCDRHAGEDCSQGQDPAGADNGEQPIPPQAEDKEVIPPPPTGDEDIHTQAPNPEAGHEEEVIPPPAPDEEPSVKPR